MTTYAHHPSDQKLGEFCKRCGMEIVHWSTGPCVELSEEDKVRKEGSRDREDAMICVGEEVDNLKEHCASLLSPCPLGDEPGEHQYGPNYCHCQSCGETGRALCKNGYCEECHELGKV